MDTVGGAAQKEMIGCFIRKATTTQGGGTVSKAMVKSMISEVTAVHTHFCKQSNTKFVLDTKIAFFRGYKFLFISRFEGRRAWGLFKRVGDGGPVGRAEGEKRIGEALGAGVEVLDMVFEIQGGMVI